MEVDLGYSVGDRVHISPYRHSLKPRPGYGIIVHIFEAEIVPDVKLIIKYYGVGMKHKLFPSFNRTLKIDRFVVQRDIDPAKPNGNEGNYLVLPTPALFLIRRIYEPQKEENDQGY